MATFRTFAQICGNEKQREQKCLAVFRKAVCMATIGSLLRTNKKSVRQSHTPKNAWL